MTPNTTSIPSMQVQPIPANGNPSSPSSSSNNNKRGPHDYSASWKIGTTDRKAAAAAAAVQPPAAGSAENGDGGGHQTTTEGSVAHQMGVGASTTGASSGTHGSGGSGGSSDTGTGGSNKEGISMNRVESLSSLSQLQMADGNGSRHSHKSDSQKKFQQQQQQQQQQSRQQPAADGPGPESASASTSAPTAADTTAPARPTTASPPQSYQSLYQDRLFNQPSDSVEAVLSASCDVMGFDIAEMWLRTGPKTHQLTNSHLRPTALEDSVRAELVDVYYGEMSSRRTHRLSPALCKRAKEAQDVVWVTANTERGAEALRCSISDVRTAVAVPVCHESSSTNITLIYFSIRRAIMRPQAVEFLVHMSLSAAVASVNSLSEDVMVDTARQRGASHPASTVAGGHGHGHHAAVSVGALRSDTSLPLYSQLKDGQQLVQRPLGGGPLVQQQQQKKKGFSITGACLDLKWSSLKNVEYLTDGGNNWIHTAVMNGRPVVVKTLKPECQDLALAINEIEGELTIHSKLDHPNIVSLVGAGTTSKGSRFVVLERLDGGTLTQHLGYDTRIRDRRRRFWKKKQFSYLEVLNCAKSVADAMAYCHGSALPGSMVLHRDLKPDNIGFTLDGTVKLIDFGLARIVNDASPESDDVYEMSGETGSLRYMAPEVADCRPYNHKADVYSFGTILWEIVAYKKPYDGMNREQFYEQVVHGGMRPPLSKKWPKELSQLIQECWDVNYNVRPNFRDISDRLSAMHANEKGGKKASARKRISALVDRHSTWF